VGVDRTGASRFYIYFFLCFLYLSFLPFLIFGNSFRTRSISFLVQR